MRIALVVAVALVPSACLADRLVSIPMGRKLPYGTLRLETLFELSRGRSQEYFVGVGFSPLFEVEFRTEYFSPQQARTTFDFSYNYVAPIPNITPGLSVGVLDVLNNSRDRTRGYLAITYRPTLVTIDGDVPGDLTLGFMFGQRKTAFVGMSLPFSRAVRGLVEHNGIRPAAGLELRVKAGLSLRFVVRDQDSLGSANWIRRF